MPFFWPNIDNLEDQMEDLQQTTNFILKELKKIMTALTDLQAAVAAEQTVEASAITLLQGLSAQLAALVAASNGSVAAADVEAVVTQINTNAAALAAAVVANTPAPAPTP